MGAAYARGPAAAASSRLDSAAPAASPRLGRPHCAWYELVAPSHHQPPHPHACTVALRCRLRVDGGVCDGSESCPSQTRSYDREHLLAKALGTALQKRANGSTTRQRAAVGRQRFGLLSKSGLPCGTGRSTTGGAAQELIAPVAESFDNTKTWGEESRRPPRCARSCGGSASAARSPPRWATASRRRSSSSPCSGPSCTASSRPALCGNQPVRRVHRVDGVGDDATIQHERAVKF